MANVIRLCGLNKSEIEQRLVSYVEKGFSVSIVENNLDARIELSHPYGDENAQAIAASYIANDFKDFIYSTFDNKQSDFVGGGKFDGGTCCVKTYFYRRN